MRITNGMIADNTLRNINKAANRLAAANEAVSSNQKIQLASDDPVVASRAITYRSYVSQIEQYQENVDAADGWQTATDDALSDLSDLITTVKTLTTEAASDTCSEEDLAAIKSRIETLRDQAVTLMNSTYAGRYIFGGYNTSEAPYEVVSTDIGDTVTFKGDYLSLGSVISADVSDADIETFYTNNTGEVYESTSAQNINYNIGFNSEVTVNIEGQDVTGTGTDNLFDTFSKLLLALDGETSYKTAALDSSGNVTVTTNSLDLSALIDEFTTDLDRVTVSQATLGARMDNVNSVSESLDDAYTAYSTLMSNNENIDTATAATELTSAEYTYEAALSVGAKAISKSLIDFIA